MIDKRLQKYRATIREKFPELPVESIEYVSEGWDSVACLVNGRLIFRFPKRSEVERRMKVEMRLLPRLTPRLPLPIPQPLYLAETPGRKIPFAFAGYELIQGEQIEDWPPEIGQEEWWRPVLGKFLTALHAFPVAEARELGVQNMDWEALGAGQASWREMLARFYQKVQAEVFPMLPEEQQIKIAHEFEAFLGNNRFFEFETTLIHGDFTDDHVLLDLEHKRITGVIDFGDVAIGDPAYDVWDSLLPYYKGKVDPSWPERRKFYPRLSPFYVIMFAAKYDDLALLEYGKAELEHTWQDVVK